jgi:Domain of unknown function (DUF3291)
VTGYEIAQLNVARALAPLDSPQLAPFMEGLAEINALAERSPGFRWRLQGESGNATELRVWDDPLVIVNLTVWATIDDLHAFTYRSDHKTVFARRFDWFERIDRPATVLWWQPAGTIPTLDEALRRLDLLAAEGPGRDAFTFKQRFPPPDDRGLPEEAAR